MKIYIIGNSGSGKTTLASKLKGQLRIPCLHLDNLYLMLKEQLIYNSTLFLDDIMLFINSNNSWIIEGIYTQVEKEIATASDFLIYLNTDEEEVMENTKKYSQNRREFLKSYYQDKRYSKNKVLIYSQGGHDILYDKYTKEKLKLKTIHSREYDEIHKII